MTDSQYILPNDIGISLLPCKEAFQLLTKKEQLYAHYLSRASWYGGLIVLVQTSPESPPIYVLLMKLFRAQSPSELELIALSVGLTADEYQALLVYAAGIFSNMGNYKSFGDTKFIPNLPKEKFEKLLWKSKAFELNPAEIKELWNICGNKMYSLDDKEKQLGLGEKGITTYFSGNCDLEDAKIVQKFLDSQVLRWYSHLRHISAYNTRLFKSVNSDGKCCYEVRLASVCTEGSSVAEEKNNKCASYNFDGATFKVVRGDYSPLMKKTVENLQKAKVYAANTHEEQMLEAYIRSFIYGSVEDHKDGSRHWIKDKGPVVECYIGFIESYRDPYGSRGEFEGFVAVVNKAMSAKFGNLVSSAEHLLSELPWPNDFEKDQFLKPDFTSLDILTFSGSGIPVGINIPNYDEIRQNEGFKNVSLGNVLSVASAAQKEKLTFLLEEDKDLFLQWKTAALEVQVGLHELLGHGSGKLFVQDEKGNFNFEKNSVRNPETGELISSWYKENETWDSKFSTIASTYEECRAESVGLYLCLNAEVLRIFGHEGKEAEDVSYINWLSMVRAGVLSLEFYTPEKNTWRQAHMQARFVILRVLLEAGEGLVTITFTTGSDGKPDAAITLDRSKIITVGKPAVEKFLRKLQVYKSTADVEGGSKMYEMYSTVNNGDVLDFITLRETVLLRKEARKMFVQVNTHVEDENVHLKEYESSAVGLICSFVERFPEDGEQLEKHLLDLYKADIHCWCH